MNWIKRGTKVKKNDSIELVIEDMGTDGEGIGHVATEDGRSIAVFVKDAVMGDTIRAAITKVKKQYVYARLVEVIKPSPYRVEPKCPVARPCGGCTLQHVSYEKQLDYKWNKVKNCLSRIGGIEHPEDLMERYRHGASVELSEQSTVPGGTGQGRKGCNRILCRQNPYDYRHAALRYSGGGQRYDY